MLTISPDSVRAVEELADLIKKRQRILGESVKDAVVASAETVLVSLRAATRLASPTKIAKRRVEVRDTGFFASFSASERRRVVRSGASPWAPKITLDGRVRWLDRGVARTSRHVYKVTPIRPGEPVYYVAAATPTVAETFERTRAYKRTDRSASLARNALSQAMALVSTKPQKAGGKPTASPPGLASVLRRESEDGFAVLIVDNLDYSIAALKGEESAITMATMKAANKIAGRLQRWIDQYAISKEEVKTPFPEIVRRRKRR